MGGGVVLVEELAELVAAVLEVLAGLAVYFLVAVEDLFEEALVGVGDGDELPEVGFLAVDFGFCTFEALGEFLFLLTKFLAKCGF